MAKSHRHGRKARRWVHHHSPPGTSPGTLAVDPEAPRPNLQAMLYGPDGVEEIASPEVSRLAGLRGRKAVLWVHCSGLGDAALLESLGKLFGIHRLALEDVVNTHQRPKVEEYEEHLFLVGRIPKDGGGGADTEQVSLFLGSDFVLSFEEGPPEAFAAVRERIRSGRGRIRHGGADYLAYALLDAQVDSFFPVLEALGERLEELEERAVAGPSRETLGRLNAAKRDMLILRRAVWPQREALGVLYRDPSPLIHAETRIYLRDCYDHTVQVIDILETYRELGSGLMDIYLSSMSNRMNEVMKVLTIIATIFMPLSFLAGLYGMNFDTTASPLNMPELGWRYGYLFALGMMGLTALAFLLFFLRKGWLTEKDFRGGREQEQERTK